MVLRGTQGLVATNHTQEYQVRCQVRCQAKCQVKCQVRCQDLIWTDTGCQLQDQEDQEQLQATLATLQVWEDPRAMMA